MIEGDWDTAVKMAKDQVAGGAHVIDVCVDYVGRDGNADMHEIASRFSTQSTVPLMIDSTEPDVVETALQHLGGRAILNSVHLEDGDAPGPRQLGRASCRERVGQYVSISVDAGTRKKK